MRWSDQLSPGPILIFIVCVYLFIGGLYAVYTPAWQAPDEPAHYNYVRYLAENGRFPVLHYGDYPHAYLEQIKAARFPPDMPVESIRYEFWQPPLYYVLATPVYRVFGGALIPLRLLSLAFGAGVVVMAYAIASAWRPGDTTLALGAAAVVAFVPMHLTMMASVNNDALAELLLAAVMLRLMRLTDQPADKGQAVFRPSDLVITGLLLGLGLVTKATVYVAIPLALIALALSERRPMPLGRKVLALFGPALALVIPWYVRNLAVYGWPDLLGTRNHAAVVVGQLRTADYLAAVGWLVYLKDLATTSFHSFWGQFGWMAVPMDRRVYLGLGLLSGLAVLGCVLAAWRGRPEGWKDGRMEERKNGELGRQRRRGTIFQSSSEAPLRGSLPTFHPSMNTILLGLWLAFTSLTYLYYNLSLVQFQGRYLFPALVPIGLCGVLGLREILSRRWMWIGVSLCGAGGLIVGAAGLLRGDLDGWGLLITGGVMLVLVVRRWLPARLDGWVLAAPFAGLAGLSVHSLFALIVPYLRP
jgi:4-amino-4-deoxy-L-arabinose transferase-like glycosyltransferase